MTTPLLTALPTPLNLQQVPYHVAIIMDGNGRWALQRNLPRTEGHRRGAQSLKTILSCCRDWGIGALTVYAFSTENWRRPRSEVNFLLGLFEHLLRRELAELCQEGVRLRYLGDLSLLPRSLQEVIQESVVSTATNPGVRLTVALNYGSRQEIARVCRQVAEQVQQGELSLDHIDEQLFAKYLDTVDVGDPDLLIRTSGEMRLSNFLLWQMAYTEIYFTETLWPDFDRRTFEKALVAYQGRDRRFGKVPA